MYFGKTDEKRHACYSCGEELVFEVKIGRRDMCPNCNAYLHSCLNCEHHDKNAHNECKENQGEFIRDRTEGNFCGHFSFRTIGDDAPSVADTAKSKLDALFGGGAAPASSAATLADFKFSPKTEDSARSALEDLFKK